MNDLTNNLATQITSALNAMNDSSLINKITSNLNQQLGNIGSTASSNIKSNINVTNINKMDLKSCINTVIKNNITNTNTTKCLSSSTNLSNINSNFEINGVINIGSSNNEIIQTAKTMANCIFTSNVINNIASQISNSSSSTLDSKSTTKSDNTQSSTISQTGFSEILGTLLSGIANIISSAYVLFIIGGILGLAFLWYYFSGDDKPEIKSNL